MSASFFFFLVWWYSRGRVRTLENFHRSPLWGIPWSVGRRQELIVMTMKEFTSDWCRVFFFFLLQFNHAIYFSIYWPKRYVYWFQKVKEYLKNSMENYLNWKLLYVFIICFMCVSWFIWYFIYIYLYLYVWQLNLSWI